jgi:hypothetical protein
MDNCSHWNKLKYSLLFASPTVAEKKKSPNEIREKLIIRPRICGDEKNSYIFEK